MINLFLYRKFNVRMPIIKKNNKKFTESFLLSNTARMSSTYRE